MSLTDKRIEEILKEVEPHAVRLPLGWKLFARAIEAEATKPKFHTTELRNPPEAVFNCGEATKPCVCGDSSAQGVFHRNDGPCYITVEEATNPQEPVAEVVHVVIPAGHATEERQSFQVNWLTIDPFKFAGPLYTNSQPCQSCDEKQSAIDVWEGRYADLSAKCAELEQDLQTTADALAENEESEKAWEMLDTERVRYLNDVGDVLGQNNTDESLINAAKRAIITIEFQKKAWEADFVRMTRMEAAIERMRIAGGKDEFQKAFDDAKGLL